MRLFGVPLGRFVTLNFSGEAERLSLLFVVSATTD
jgi:hypothetical protein